MTYKWKQHQQELRRLYIDEGKSLDEIVEHMRVHHNFTPSKRAFQTSFARWNFPNKQRNPHKDERIVARVKVLWEKNFPQKEMLRVLNEEDGFDINERELRRLRVKNGWFLRSKRGEPTSPIISVAHLPDASPDADGDETRSQPDAPNESPSISLNSLAASTPQQSPNPNKLGSPPFVEITLKNSRKNLRAKDANGNMVKFPSEMPVDEARKVLSLDEKEYTNIRNAFQKICNEEGITKKTLAGAQAWERVKDRLTSDSEHLRNIIWLEKDDFNTKKLALDVICTAVTKRIRVAEAQVNFNDIKNVLGVNPEDFRQFRICFHQLLADADFINKSVITSPLEWEALKRKAAETTGLMQKLRTWGNDPQAPEMRRAFDKLAQYVRKRLKEDLAKDAAKKAAKQAKLEKALANAKLARDLEGKGKEAESQASPTPGTGERVEEPTGKVPVRPSKTDKSRPSRQEKMQEKLQDNSGTDLAPEGPDGMQDESEASGSGPPVPAMQNVSARGVPPPQRRFGSTAHTAMPLGPAGSHGAHMGASMLLQQNSPTAYMEQQYGHAQYGVTASSQPAAFHPVPIPVPSGPPAMAMFLRLHPTSTFTTGIPMWVGTLRTPSIHELRRAAVEKFPNAICDRIEGMVKHSGGEIPLRVEDDDELAAYLLHIQTTPTFAVRLIWKT